MGKTAWIIGASTGIGASLAKALWQEGYNLALTARTHQALEDLKASLPPLPLQHASIHACDVMSLLDLHGCYRQILVQHGSLDLAVYGAGVYTPMALKEFDVEKCTDILDVNLKGAFHTFDVLKDHALNPQKPLHIAWIASVSGYRGLPRSGAYGVSKAGLLYFAEIQRLELAGFQTKIQVINPGFVKTRLTDLNDFPMPQLMTADQAADHICRGLKGNKFEIAFPFGLVSLLKLIRILPQWLYFKVMARL